MIAANIRRYPQAAAIQGVLRLGKPVWALERPSTRILRKIRQERAALIKGKDQIVEWVKTVTPQWVKDAMAKARKMVKEWKQAQMELEFNKEIKAEKAKSKQKPTVWKIGEVVLPDESDCSHTMRFIGGYRLIGRTCGKLNGMVNRTKQYGYGKN